MVIFANCPPSWTASELVILWPGFIPLAREICETSFQFSAFSSKLALAPICVSNKPETNRTSKKKLTAES